MLQLKSKIYILFSAIALLFAYKTYAQHSCGTTHNTILSAAQASKESVSKAFKNQYYTLRALKGTNSNVLQSIPVQVYVLSNTPSNFNLNTEKEAISRSISHLNRLFNAALFRFYQIAPVRIIPTTHNVLIKGEEQQITSAHYTPNAINIYIAPSLLNTALTSICGYITNTKPLQSIVMQRDCMYNNSSLAHEFGHFFSLLHTHGASNIQKTRELVNGSNCASTGDGICDTPADPLITPDVIDNFCGYNGAATDANGDLYRPDTKNIMSYAHKACRSHFSEQQQARMFSYFQTIKPLFSGFEAVPSSIETSRLDTKLSDVTIYPNPATETSLHIKTDVTEALNYSIMNYKGQVFSKGVVYNNTVNVTHLPQGIYLLAVRSRTSQVIRKFMK